MKQLTKKQIITISKGLATAGYVEVKDGNINLGNLTIKIKGMQDECYPKDDFERLFLLNGDIVTNTVIPTEMVVEFKDLEEAVKYTSTDLNMLCFNNGILEAVDGRKAMRKTIPNFTIDKQVFLEAKIIKKLSGKIDKLYYHTDGFFFTEDGSITIKEFDTKGNRFPNLDMIIKTPSANDEKIIVNRQELIDTLKGFKTYVNKESNKIVVRNGMIVADEYYTLIPSLETERFTGLNLELLLQIAETHDCEILELSSGSNVSQQYTKSHCVTVLMPMKFEDTNSDFHNKKEVKIEKKPTKKKTVTRKPTVSNMEQVVKMEAMEKRIKELEEKNKELEEENNSLKTKYSEVEMTSNGMRVQLSSHNLGNVHKGYERNMRSGKSFKHPMYSNQVVYKACKAYGVHYLYHVKSKISESYYIYTQDDKTNEIYCTRISDHNISPNDIDWRTLYAYVHKDKGFYNVPLFAQQIIHLIKDKNKKEKVSR